MADNKVVMTPKPKMEYHEPDPRYYEIAYYTEAGDPVWRIKDKYKPKTLGQTVGYFIRGLLP